jgi:hypothetical protein
LQRRLLCLTARSKRAGLMPPCMKFPCFCRRQR